MKCTVNQMQSTASPLSGEVILLATAYVSFVQDVLTAILQFINYKSWESLQDWSPDSSLALYPTQGSSSVNQTEDLHKDTFKYSRPEILKHKKVVV